MALKLGSKGETVRAIQGMLNFLGSHVRSESPGEDDFVPVKIDGDYGKRTQAAVAAFQTEHGLLADGVVGPVTLKALEDEYRTTMMALASPGVDSVAEVPKRLTFERVPADAHGQGYSSLWLRSDTAERYRAVCDEASIVGAKVTSSGGRRDLHAPVSAGRSATSFHYTGRALDLYLYGGMVNPEKDPHVIVQEPDPLLYRVYARCDAAHAQVHQLSRVVTYKKRTGVLATEGAFVDLTALFERHGFRRIRARPSFAQGGSEIGAEWWHFQDESNLTSGVTTFGDELLAVYSRATLESSPPWKYRDHVFGVNWG